MSVQAVQTKVAFEGILTGLKIDDPEVVQRPDGICTTRVAVETPRLVVVYKVVRPVGRGVWIETYMVLVDDHHRLMLGNKLGGKFIGQEPAPEFVCECAGESVCNFLNTR